MALDNCIRAKIFIQLQNSIRYFGSPCTTKPNGLTCSRVFVFGKNISSSYSVDPKSGCI